MCSVLDPRAPEICLNKQQVVDDYVICTATHIFGFGFVIITIEATAKLIIIVVEFDPPSFLKSLSLAYQQIFFVGRP